MLFFVCFCYLISLFKIHYDISGVDKKRECTKS